MTNPKPPAPAYHSLAQLPLEPDTSTTDPIDWLIDSSPYTAGIYRNNTNTELILSNGLIRRTFRLSPNAATVALDNLTTGASLLRGIKPEAEVEINTVSYTVGGLNKQPNYAFLRPAWLEQLNSDPDAFQFTGFTIAQPHERLPWKRVRHHAPHVDWPPKGIYLSMDYCPPQTASLDLTLTVHYELYDGIPLFSKWLTIHNNGNHTLTINHCVSELLAAVEYSSVVEHRGHNSPTPNIHVETDYSFGGDSSSNAKIHSVHWETDPDFLTQVNYNRLTPCLLKIYPEMGPCQALAPGEIFKSIHAFVLPFDSYERERCGLAQRRMYRTIAPWVTENPLMMHVRFATWESVKQAIDQCAEVGFELVIMTFGSGFEIENENPDYLEQMQQYALYARTKNIELGGYSLLASRHIDTANDVVMPTGKTPTFGHSPCLQSVWGQDYFRKLYQFYQKTGHTLLEHDGSYPGDVCTATHHPGHNGLEDSQWQQWRLISDFYKWCRAEGIYLNVPDYYYLVGTNKSGMGYREVNWSLPRDEQVFHTRQNIFDGTWEKTSSMGWMFVPLSEYHGGGDAATIEPLDTHIEHYQRMLISNLAMGVQACYRGPRLYDTARTKTMVQESITWFKQYRDILESDMIHGRRTDGRDLDWMLHVNPQLQDKGMLVVFNPLKEQIKRSLKINLYYTGLTATAQISHQAQQPQTFTLARDYSIHLEIKMKPESFTWFLIK